MRKKSPILGGDDLAKRKGKKKKKEPEPEPEEPEEYELTWKKGALKAHEKLPQKDQDRLIPVIEDLPGDPRPRKAKLLVIGPMAGAYQINVGKFRIVYTVDDDQRKIVIYDADLKVRTQKGAKGKGYSGRT